MTRLKMAVLLVLLIGSAGLVLWPFEPARPQVRLGASATEAMLSAHAGERVELEGTLDLQRKYAAWISCGASGAYMQGADIRGAQGDVVRAVGVLRRVEVKEPAPGELVTQSLAPGQHFELEGARVRTVRP